ncbi:hypothetical protein BX666DRAFT_1882453 [Dichotomocladium elegans]|nr:hypothetical protein BX666DRAFT_1882453 [Dichotomocladium elegans]
MRHFVFMNVPPIDRTPKYSTVQAHLASRVQMFNTMLQDHIRTFRETRPENSNTTIIDIDTHRIFSELYDNAHRYGINATTGYYDHQKKGKNALALEQYFYKDEFHPSYVVHQVLADAIQEQLDARK